MFPEILHSSAGVVHLNKPSKYVHIRIPIYQHVLNVVKENAYPIDDYLRDEYAHDATTNYRHIKVDGCDHDDTNEALAQNYLINTKTYIIFLITLSIV